MRALEILKDLLFINIKSSETDKNDVIVKAFESAMRCKLKLAIKELEEVMKPETCDGCKFRTYDAYDLGDLVCSINGNCKRAWHDRYEPKANA